MESLLQTIAGVAGLALLYFGAEWLVKGGCAIAAKCRISPLIVGLTLVAFGTSAPELFVSVDAALEGMGDMSVGNVVGSNICNIALILGLSALISPLSVNSQLFRRDVPLLVVVSATAAGICGMCAGMGRIEGAVLFAGIIVYTVVGIAESRRSESVGDVPAQMSVARGILLSVVGLAALVAGSKCLLSAAVFMAKALGVSEGVIALTVVAVGTSLPELATSVVAAIKGEKDIAIGNVVGSNIFNILGILGLSALLKPVSCPHVGWIDLSVMVFLAFVLWPIMKTGRIISRREGVFLLAVYFGYVAYLCKTAL